jgi:hypothetical protein
MMSFARAQANAIRLVAGQRTAPILMYPVLATFCASVELASATLPPGVSAVALVEQPLIVWQRGIEVPQRRHVLAAALAHFVFADRAWLARPQRERTVMSRAFADELLVPQRLLATAKATYQLSATRGEDSYLDVCALLASDFRVEMSVIKRQLASFIG